MHPDSKNANWSNEIINNWKKSNPAVIENLQYATIYEHAEHEFEKVSEESFKKFQEVMDYFKKASK